MIEPNDASLEPREQLANAAAFLRRVLRAWRAALSVLVIGAIAGAAFLLIRKPMFRSETVILYSEVARPGDDGERPTTARSVTLRLKEILMSRASLATVVQEFNLYPDVQRTRGLVDATEELKKHIEFRAPGGDTFSVAFDGNSPTQAQAVTARLANVIIAQDGDLRRKQASSLRDFLDSEKRSTQDALRDAELALASFMAAHPRFALDATPLATGAAIRASLGGGGVAPAPTSAEARPARARPRHATPSSSEEGSHPSVGEVPPAPREAAAEEERAKADLAAAKANLMELAARFTPAHPDVRAAQVEVERATRRLAAATAAVAAGSPGPVAGPRTSVAVTATPLPSPPAIASHPTTGAPSSAEQVATATPSRSPPDDPPKSPRGDVVALETEWVKLTRATTEARQQEDQVEAALFKTKSAADAENGDGVQVTMIDPAFLPQSAVPPGRTVIAALFAAGALFIAVLVALMSALLDDRVYEGRDVEQLAPTLASVPRRAHA